MKKKITKAMAVAAIGLSALVANTESLAQGTPLACQAEAAGGLKWEGYRWNIAKFTERKFILVIEEGMVTKDSAAKALVIPEGVSCNKEPLGRISCIDHYGGYLFFDPNELRGTVAQLNRGTTENTAVYVEVFSCQRF